MNTPISSNIFAASKAQIGEGRNSRSDLNGESDNAWSTLGQGPLGQNSDIDRLKLSPTTEDRLKGVSSDTSTRSQYDANNSNEDSAQDESSQASVTIPITVQPGVFNNDNGSVSIHPGLSINPEEMNEPPITVAEITISAEPGTLESAAEQGTAGAMAAGTGAVVTGAGAFVLPASAVGGLAGVGSVLMENVDVGISRTPDSSGESNYPDWSPSDNDGDWSDTTMNDGGGNSLSQAAAADVAAAETSTTGNRDRNYSENDSNSDTDTGSNSNSDTDEVGP